MGWCLCALARAERREVRIPEPLAVLIDRFASILSAVLGLTGVMFVLKGVARLSPDLIAKVSQTYLEFNVTQIQNLASQKADFVTGAVLILIACLIQTGALLFLREPFLIFEDYWHAAGLAVVTSVIIVIVFFGVNRGMSKHYQEQAKFSLAKSYFQAVLKQDLILLQHLKTTEDVAASLFGIEKEPAESGKEFLSRLAKRFDISLPRELHLEEERSPG
jgi:hypothetical protein